MTTSEPSQATFWPETESPSTSSAAASPARISPLQESALASKVRDLVCGASTPGSFASYDPHSSSWKTSQACLVPHATHSGASSPHQWAPFSETWPRSGMMRSGIAYRRPPSAPLTGATGSGLWLTPSVGDSRAGPVDTQNQLMLAHQVKMLPTPSASLGTHAGLVTPSKARLGGTLVEHVAHEMWPTPVAKDGSKGMMPPRAWDTGVSLPQRVAERLLATPTTRDWRSGKASAATMARDWRSGKASAATMARNARPLSEQIGGQLNPAWVEWLMGFPLGWTALKDWATPSSRRSRSSSAAPSSPPSRKRKAERQPT